MCFKISALCKVLLALKIRFSALLMLSVEPGGPTWILIGFGIYHRKVLGQRENENNGATRHKTAKHCRHAGTRTAHKVNNRDNR